jgi:biopolymer transport protein ExbD
MLRGESGPLFPKIKIEGAKVYDFIALQARLENIKAQYPSNRRVMIMADADVIYDDITHAMDAARASKTGQPMFDDVAFIPGVME